MRLKKHNRFIEYLLGISMPMIGLVIISFFTQEFGILGLSAIGTSILMILFLTIGPLIGFGAWSFSGLDVILNLLSMAAFTITFYALWKYLNPPYLRFGIAVHFALWLVFGIRFTAVIY